MPQYSYRLVFPVPYLKHLPVPSFYFSQLSHVHLPLLLVQQTFTNYMNPVFALPAAITLEVVVFIVYSSPISSSTFSKANVPGPEFDLELCPCIHWSK
ncbi:unnamed protein product [Ectocarpus fasciculatus]